MRKYVFFSLIFIIMLSTGCISEDVESYNIDEKEFLFNRYDGKEIRLKYIQVSGLSNVELETRINEMLKAELTQWINLKSEWYERDPARHEWFERFQPEVKLKSPRYLSVCYTARWEHDNGSDYMGESVRVGITIDILEGRRVYLKDLFEDESVLKRELENYEYNSEFTAPIDSDEADKIIYEASLSMADYLDELSQTDPLAYEEIMFDLFWQPKPSFYLLEDTVVVTRSKYEISDAYLSFNGKLD